MNEERIIMAKLKKINALCKMCKNDCKEMHKYGKEHVQPGCYFIKGDANENKRT